jgi:hypothetical protein
MKITVNLEGKVHNARHPYEACEYVSVKGVDCPLCKDLVALVDFDGKTQALAPKEMLKEAHKDFPKCEEKKYLGPLQARLPNPSRGHDTFSGPAECTRCRQEVGTMTVRVNTLFSIEEDDHVLNGRCRVY